MTSPIGSSGSIPSFSSQPTENLTSLAQKMQTQLADLVQNLNNLSTDRSQANHVDFLKNMADNVSALHESVTQVLNRGS